MAERTVNNTSVGEPYRTYRVQSTVDETKSSVLSTEFWAYIAAVAALAIATITQDELISTDFWRWATYLTIGYMISRGLAKSGSHHTDVD